MINSDSSSEILITPGKYLRLFGTLALTVFGLHLLLLPFDIFYSLDLAQFFSVRYEYNLPTLFSSLNLGLGTIFGACLFAQSKTSREKRFWLIVSIAMLIMSYDEAAQMHEFYGQKIYNILFNEEIPYFASKWLQVYMPLISISCLYFSLEAIRLPTYKYKLILPVCLFLLGSTGVEFINYYFSHVGSPLGVILETIEEFLEIGSIVLLNYEFLVIASNRPGPVKIVISN